MTPMTRAYDLQSCRGDENGGAFSRLSAEHFRVMGSLLIWFCCESPCKLVGSDDIQHNRLSVSPLGSDTKQTKILTPI